MSFLTDFFILTGIALWVALGVFFFFVLIGKIEFGIDTEKKVD